MGGFGRVWEGLRGFGRVWDLGGLGRVGGSGRVWEALGFPKSNRKASPKSIQ